MFAPSFTGECKEPLSSHKYWLSHGPGIRQSGEACQLDFTHTSDLQKRYYNLFFYGEFFDVLVTKHAIIKCSGSWLREVINTTKFSVVAVTHGDDSQLFSCCQKKATRKCWLLSPWLMATSLIFFLLPEGTWQEKVEVCCRDSWRQNKKIIFGGWPKKFKGRHCESLQRPSILLFRLLPLKFIWNLNIACFLAKKSLKIPIKN